MAYAKKHAKSSNPAYYRFSNDCTSFVSQALLEGGWTMEGGCWDRKSDWAWWYGDWTCPYCNVYSCRTWSVSEDLYNHMKATGKATRAANVYDLGLGDVLQMEFVGKGAYNPGNIGHTMLVTGTRGGDLQLSYHSKEKLDEPFWAPGGILHRNPHNKYYGWKLKP